MRKRTWIFVVLVALLIGIVPALVLADDDDGLQHRGLIESMPDGGGQGTWVVGGKTFQATADTEYDVEEGPLTLGACAEVDYVVEGDMNVARKIDSESADDCGENDFLEHEGLITDMPAGGGAGVWVIGGLTVEATDTTVFDESDGALELGACADVDYVVEGALNVAKKIKTEDGDCSGSGEKKARGTIDSLPADGLIGTWMIRGTAYIATKSTEFEQSDGPFEVGACVDVEYIVQNENNIATEIETEDDCDDVDTQEVTGKLEAFAEGLIGKWTVDGVNYTANDQTKFDTRHGDFAVGVCVKIEYVVDSGVNVAREIETEEADECDLPDGEPAEFETKGVIDALPTTGTLTGTWTISGEDYTADMNTRFEQEHGSFEVGTCVEVEYRLDGDTRIATKIETEDDDDCGKEEDEHEVYGEIEALPDTTDLTGMWTIGGKQYEVTSDTALEDGPFVVGLTVEVKYRVASDGTRVAMKIEGKRAVDDDDKDLAQAYGLIEDFPTGLVGTWTVGGTTYEATADTKFEEEDGRTFAVDVCVKVLYTTQDGTRTAVKIETESPDDCQDEAGQDESKAYGFVTQRPNDGVVGTWIIGGAEYEVTTATKLEAEHGSFAVGSFVKVEYVVQDGVRVATEMETHVPPDAGDDTALGTLQTGGLQTSAATPQTWQVNGRSYTVTQATILDDSAGDLVDGQLVRVNGYDDNGTLTATTVTALQEIHSVHLPIIAR